jgi:hypothetical protein
VADESRGRDLGASSQFQTSGLLVSAIVWIRSVVTRTEAQAIVKELTKSIDVIGLVVGLKFLATPNDEDISCRLW